MPTSFDLEKLDNLIFHALDGPHADLLIQGQRLVRYHPDFFNAAALREAGPAAFAELRELTPEDDVAGLIIDQLPDELPGWEVQFHGSWPQMICADPSPVATVQTVTLTAEDVPAMLELVAVTEPGPFRQRAIEMGPYLGVKLRGELVAMAGTRMRGGGFSEISAVCTHPDFRGRGYAAALTAALVEQIRSWHEIPFLHVAPNNYPAQALYKKLGFAHTRDVPIAFLKRIG